MKCYKCGSKARVIVPSLQKPACDKCFARIIEKRFNKNMRGIGLNKVIIEVKRPSDRVLKHLLEKRAKRVREFSFKTGKSNINQSTLDDVAINIIMSFFQNKDYLIREQSPLMNISEKELIDYARIKGVDFKGNKRSGSDKRIHEFLLELNKRRPGVMYSIKDFIERLKQAQ